MAGGWQLSAGGCRVVAGGRRQGGHEGRQVYVLTNRTSHATTSSGRLSRYGAPCHDVDISNVAIAITAAVVVAATTTTNTSTNTNNSHNNNLPLESSRVESVQLCSYLCTHLPTYLDQHGKVRYGSYGTRPQARTHATRAVPRRRGEAAAAAVVA